MHSQQSRRFVISLLVLLAALLPQKEVCSAKPAYSAEPVALAQFVISDALDPARPRSVRDPQGDSNPQGLGGSENELFMPTVLRNARPLSAPLLDDIGNPDGDGSFTVSWQAAPGATSHELQEDDSEAFSSPRAVYSGPSTSASISVLDVGTYYYRVRAVNAFGSSDWSLVRSTLVSNVTVAPSPGNYVGSRPSVSFDLAEDLRVCNLSITVPFGIDNCRIRPSGCGELTGTSFIFIQIAIGAIYEISGTFDSPIHASGGYQARMCGDTLIFPPSEDSWEASKQAD